MTKLERCSYTIYTYYASTNNICTTKPPPSSHLHQIPLDQGSGGCSGGGGGHGDLCANTKRRHRWNERGGGPWDRRHQRKRCAGGRGVVVRRVGWMARVLSARAYPPPLACLRYNNRIAVRLPLYGGPGFHFPVGLHHSFRRLRLLLRRDERRGDCRGDVVHGGRRMGVGDEKHARTLVGRLALWAARANAIEEASPGWRCVRCGGRVRWRRGEAAVRARDGETEDDMVKR